MLLVGSEFLRKLVNAAGFFGSDQDFKQRPNVAMHNAADYTCSCATRVPDDFAVPKFSCEDRILQCAME